MPIASTAIVHPNARVHVSTTIGDYSIVEDEVEIGPNNRIDSHVVIKRYTTIGENNHLYAGSHYGTDPMDKKFREENRSYLRIGSNNIIRECTNISRGTQPESTTVLGDNIYIMSNVHVAHDTQMGSNVTIGPSCGIGGYAYIEHDAFISHGVGVHQFSKVGCHTMVAANCRVAQDVPPYLLVSHFDVEAHGLNIVGLRRSGFSREAITALKQAYRLLYRSNLARQEALARIEALGTPETAHFVAFIRSSKRGICPDHRTASAVGPGF